MDSNQANDNTNRISILDRLDKFLPAMAASNKELEKIKTDGQNSIQIDSMLYKNEAEIEDDDSKKEEDDDTESLSEKISKHNKQMIEMNVTLGNFDSNPLIDSLLLHKEDSSCENTSNDDGERSRDEKDTSNEHNVENKIKLLFQTKKETEIITEIASKGKASSEKEEVAFSPLIMELQSTKRRKIEN